MIKEMKGTLRQPDADTYGEAILIQVNLDPESSEASLEIKES